jgi:hypothetical protein
MPEKKLCFVVGPIGSEGEDARVHADWVLHGIIEPVFANRPDFTVKRADKDATPGQITSQMINDLLDAELVIADLALLNPNAFYEIGIRHMAEKPIIHLNPDKTTIPFDLAHFRTVHYSLLKVQDIDKAKADLGHMVEAVLADGYQVENPVTAARGRAKLKEHATPEAQLLLAEVDALKGRVSDLEASQATPTTYVLPPLPDAGLAARFSNSPDPPQLANYLYTPQTLRGATVRIPLGETTSFGMPSPRQNDLRVGMPAPGGKPAASATPEAARADKKPKPDDS